MSYAGIFTDKNNVDHPVTSVLYGTCATAANEAAKVVTCSDFDTLMAGVTIRVKFTNGNSASNPTININSTGAKSVYRFGSTAPVGDNSWEAGSVVELTYDGTSFFMTGSDDIGALYNALDAKQPITDNTLQTTSKTVPGAINEVRSDLTNYQVQNDLNLETPDRKNILPITIDILKALNTVGTWTNNVYAQYEISYTISTNSAGYVTSIETSGIPSRDCSLVLLKTTELDNYNGMIISGCPANGSHSTYFIYGLFSNASDQWAGENDDFGEGETITVPDNAVYFSPKIFTRKDVNMNNKIFTPMIRPATITDPTFAPYIPSVESRIEAVESAITPIMPSSDITYIPFGNCVVVTGTLNGNDNSSLPLGIPTNYYGVVTGRFVSTGKMSLYYVDSGYLRGWDGTTNRTFPSTDGITISGILRFTQ